MVSAPGCNFQPTQLENIQQQEKIANLAPLRLAAFGARKTYELNHMVALTSGYGSLVQLSAGMWETASGDSGSRLQSS